VVGLVVGALIAGPKTHGNCAARFINGRGVESVVATPWPSGLVERAVGQDRRDRAVDLNVYRVRAPNLVATGVTLTITTKLNGRIDRAHDFGAVGYFAHDQSDAVRFNKMSGHPQRRAAPMIGVKSVVQVHGHATV
jgi:hypothetical protein